MDIDEEINEDKDIEDIYDDESDSFAPEDINDELEKNTNISESEVCKNKFSNNIIVSNNDSNYHHYLYNIKLSDENIIEEKIDKYYSFKESPVIDFENYLSKDIENIYLKMSPLELFMFMFDEYIIKIVEYSKLFASHRYNSNNLGSPAIFSIGLPKVVIIVKILSEAFLKCLLSNCSYFFGLPICSPSVYQSVATLRLLISATALPIREISLANVILASTTLANLDFLNKPESYMSGLAS
jgi:hypothetical protein